jgi:hypothetical protein
MASRAARAIASRSSAASVTNDIAASSCCDAQLETSAMHKPIHAGGDVRGGIGTGVRLALTIGEPLTTMQLRHSLDRDGDASSH